MNKTALITGSARRIGRSMANHLADRGWNIAIHYNTSGDEAMELCNELQAHYPAQHFYTFGANLNETKEIENLFPDVIKKFGSIHLLINNASEYQPASVLETTANFFDNQINVHLKAPFILTRDFARICGKGLIINMVDTRIITNNPKFAAYTLSKKALWELTKMAAVEFGPEIRVNAMAPGLTLAPENKNENYLLKLAERIPMKRPGGVEPILKSLDYIIDNEYVTGQILYCDGGENLI